ncbi:MAG: DUF2249 domain-containing protein [Deltaproteobacteria bacterium]|nr:DUF2249 domain-containing protein [Deltaproteobacteria bacterium]
MEWFSPDAARREQILAAALDLLATTPIDRLTTREIAAAVGVSQPALFRHFRNREAILVAVAERARGALEGEIAAMLETRAPGDRSPIDDCAALARVLAEHIARHPGLPRLLYADLDGDQAELRTAIGQLVSMQRSLVVERVGEAVRRGQARADADPQAAGDLFVAMLQGLPLAARTQGTPPVAWPSRLEPQLQMWIAALRPGTAADHHPSRAAVPAGRQGLHALDVRPILAAGRDPLGDIVGLLDTLAAGAVLVVTAPFRPRPLEALLSSKGHAVTAFAGEQGAWSLLVGVGGEVAMADLTDLDPPEPLERAVAIGRGLALGAAAYLRTPRNPRWLPPQLHAVGCSCTVVELADGSAIVHLGRPT